MTKCTEIITLFITILTPSLQYIEITARARVDVPINLMQSEPMISLA